MQEVGRHKESMLDVYLYREVVRMTRACAREADMSTCAWVPHRHSSIVTEENRTRI